MPQPQKGLFKAIWNEFVKSLRVTPDRYLGEFRGEDHLGNKYYELGPDPRGGRSRASRWYESKDEDYLQELPVEWMAWLRRQRSDPPTKEEISRNMEAAEKRRQNASRVETRHYQEEPQPAKPSTKTGFPEYNEYEKYPGQYKS